MRLTTLVKIVKKKAMKKNTKNCRKIINIKNKKKIRNF